MNVELLEKLENEKKNDDTLELLPKNILIMNEEAALARKREDELNINIKKASKITELSEDAETELDNFH